MGNSSSTKTKYARWRDVSGYFGQGVAPIRLEGIGDTLDDAIDALSHKCKKHGHPCVVYDEEEDMSYCGMRFNRLNPVFLTERISVNVVVCVAYVYFAG